MLPLPSPTSTASIYIVPHRDIYSTVSIYGLSSCWEVGLVHESSLWQEGLASALVLLFCSWHGKWRILKLYMELNATGLQESPTLLISLRYLSSPFRPYLSLSLSASLFPLPFFPLPLILPLPISLSHFSTSLLFPIRLPLIPGSAISLLEHKQPWSF